MAKSKTLKDRLTGERVYPVTTTRSVFNAEGLDVDTLLEKLSDDVTRRLLGYATTEDLAGKADSFGTDASLTLADGILGISQARRDEVSAAIEAAKKQLFVEIWLQTLAKFSKMPTYAEDVANTKPDGSQFGLNRLVMGYETALKCLIYSDTHHRAGSFAHNRFYNNQQPADIKTLFPVIADNYGGNSCHSMYGGNAVIEAVCLYDNKGAITEPTQASYMFSNCTKLKYIYGTLDLSSASIPSNTNAIFDNNYELTEVRIYHVKASLSLAQSPKLSLASIQYLVDNAANTSAITITLHPDAFARLTDELVEAAQAKNISFVTP